MRLQSPLLVSSVDERGHCKRGTVACQSMAHFLLEEYRQSWRPCWLATGGEDRTGQDKRFRGKLFVNLKGDREGHVWHG